jgi:hypothetical protein
MMTATPADMLTMLSEEGSVHGAVLDDRKLGWFGWQVIDAGTGQGTLAVTWQPVDDENGPRPSQKITWQLGQPQEADPAARDVV